MQFLAKICHSCKTFVYFPETLSKKCVKTKAPSKTVTVCKRQEIKENQVNLSNKELRKNR